MLSTQPASAYPEADSATRIKTPSALVLVAMGLGMAPAEAIALAAARAAEAARLAGVVSR